MFKKDYVIGLDIGSSSVKMAQFIEAKEGLRLVKAGLQEVAKTGDSSSDDKEVLSALRNILKGIDIKRSKIVVNINCPHTAVQKIVAPYMPKNELRQGIALEAKSYFPFSIDKSYLDFEVSADIVEKGVRKYEVMVAVCPVETANRYLSILGKVGIKPAAFVSSSYTLHKMAEHSYAKEGEAKCFMDMGESGTELIIIKGKYLMFARKLPFSGSDFTKALTAVAVSDKGKVQLSMDEAEKIKCEVGLSGANGTGDPGSKISQVQIVSMLRPLLDQLVSEVQRCFDYYREASAGSEIKSLIMFGGGSSLSGLVKYLSESLEMDVRLGDAFEHIEIQPKTLPGRDKLSYRIEIAIGAALSAAKGINLLPVEIKEEKKRLFHRSTVEAIGTAVILSSILIFIGMKLQLNSVNQKIGAAKLELSSLEPQLRKLEAKALANSVLINEPQWEDVFKELSNLIPDNVYLTGLSMDNNVMTMKGNVISEHGDTILADFILTLEKGIFSNVKLVESKHIGEKQGIEFELKCWVDYENS